MISAEALAKFKQIWKEQFGEDIPDEIALEEAVSLLSLFNAIYRPLKTEWVAEYDKKTNSHKNK